MTKVRVRLRLRTGRKKGGRGAVTRNGNQPQPNREGRRESRETTGSVGLCVWWLWLGPGAGSFPRSGSRSGTSDRRRKLIEVDRDVAGDGYNYQQSAITNHTRSVAVFDKRKEYLSAYNQTDKLPRDLFSTTQTCHKQPCLRLEKSLAFAAMDPKICVE